MFLNAVRSRIGFTDRPRMCGLLVMPTRQDRLQELVGPVAYERLKCDGELTPHLAAAQDHAQLGDSAAAVGDLDAAAAGYLAAGADGPAAVLLAAAGVIAQEDGHLAVARDRFAGAIEAAERAGCDLPFAVGALGLGGVWVHEHRSPLERARVRELQRQALARLDPGDPLALRLRARLRAEDCYLADAPQRVLGVVDEARSWGNPSVLADVLSLAHHCLLGPEHADTRAALAEDLMAVSVATGRPLDALMGLAWSTVDLFLRGHPHAERSFRELQRREESTGVACIRFVVAAIETMLAVRAGKLDEAERLAGECRALGETVGDADALGWYFAHLVTIRWLQGRGHEVLPAVAELIHSSELAEPNESFVAAVAALAASAGQTEEAQAALQQLRGTGGLASLRTSSTWLVTLLGVIEAAHLLNDQTAAEEAYRLLAPYADLPVMASLAVACFGSAHRPLGLAALTAGDAERAVQHLEAAVKADVRLGHAPAQVLSRAALAEALRARDAHGDRVRAAALLDTAIEQGRRLGLRGRVAAWERVRDAAAQPLASGRVEMQRSGRDWRVVVGDRAVAVPHSVGMTYLAELVRNPGVEMTAVELASRHELAREAQHHPMLDNQARAEYRQRVADLQDEIADADHHGDLERAARARLELDWLVDELARATGLAGRARGFDDSTERARTSVQKAIKRALARISEADQGIGAELRRRVVTGGRCVFYAS